MKVNDDQSIFAWNLRRFPQSLGWDHLQSFEELGFASQEQNQNGFRAGPLLAISPSYFENSGNVITSKRARTDLRGPHFMTNHGLQIEIPFASNEVKLLDLNYSIEVSGDRLYYVLLRCVEDENPYCPIAMCVMKLGENIFARALHANAIAAVVNWPGRIRTFI